MRRGVAAVNAEANAVSALLNGGTVRLYDGSQPMAVDDPVTTQTLIAELRFGSPAFQVAAWGVARAHAIRACLSAVATGTPTWFRASAADNTPVYDGSVGLPGTESDLEIDHVPIHERARVTIGVAMYRALAE